jgi:membrane protein YdbS with pleckstrin-like domain
MAYPQKLLSDGEAVVLEMRPHWRALVFPAFWLIVIAGAGAYLAGTVDGTLRWLVLAIALALLVWLAVIPFLTWLSSQYVITNRRIITRSGILARRGRDMPLSKVNDVSFSYGVIDRMLGCGTIDVQSAGENQGIIIANVPRVEEIQREIARLHEEDDARRRRGGGAAGDIQ